jgi:hypothetical protein
MASVARWRLMMGSAISARSASFASRRHAVHIEAEMLKVLGANACSSIAFVSAAKRIRRDGLPLKANLFV